MSAVSTVSPTDVAVPQAANPTASAPAVSSERQEVPVVMVVVMEPPVSVYPWRTVAEGHHNRTTAQRCAASRGPDLLMSGSRHCMTVARPSGIARYSRVAAQ